MANQCSVQNTSKDEEHPWALRSYEPGSQDEDALLYLLGVSYTRTHAARRAGASRAGGSRNDDERDAGATQSVETIAKQKAFLEAHRPIWTWLLANAMTTLAVMPDKPHIILGWALIGDPNVVHAVGAKRSVVQAKLAIDLLGDLLGDRLKRHQVCTLELPQFRAKRRDGSFPPDSFGIERPREWSLDPTWLLTRMGERRAA